jgi:hypothetical protein
MDSGQVEKYTINRDYIKSYCASYTNNILETAFKESPFLQGRDLKGLCNPEQINFNLLKAIFLQWEAEVSKFENPYFDHDAPAVQNALKTYMEVLSRHIKLDKGSLRPLLQEAVEETLYQVFSPVYFFENFLWPPESSRLKFDELIKLRRFLKINAAFFDGLLLPWKETNKMEVAQDEYWKRLQLFSEEFEEWEDTADYVQAFSKVVALNVNNLWNKTYDSSEERKDQEINNVNQQFAKDVVSLNEILQKDQTTLVDQLTKKVEKIDNLKKGLNINQKFRFVNELYGGNSSEFNETIEKIDQSSGYHEAIKILESESSLRSQWDMEDETVKELIQLISNRFNEPGPAFDERPSSTK